MTDHAIVAPLKYIHASYNTFVILLFLYQGWLGLTIRRDRKTRKPLKSVIVRRHRESGPIFALLGVLGFSSGATIVFLDHGHLLSHPLHFLTGLTIALSIMTTFFISKKIKGRESPWRSTHFTIGIIIICLYFIQAFLGLRLLFLK